MPTVFVEKENSVNEREFNGSTYRKIDFWSELTITSKTEIFCEDIECEYYVVRRTYYKGSAQGNVYTEISLR